MAPFKHGLNVELVYQNGWLTWGSANSSYYTSNVTYTPVTSTLPAGHYWGINQTVMGQHNVWSSR